jgi:hypothetical protein
MRALNDLRISKQWPQRLSLRSPEQRNQPRTASAIQNTDDLIGELRPTGIEVCPRITG